MSSIGIYICVCVFVYAVYTTSFFTARKVRKQLQYTINKARRWILYTEKSKKKKQENVQRKQGNIYCTASKIRKQLHICSVWCKETTAVLYCKNSWLVNEYHNSPRSDLIFQRLCPVNNYACGCVPDLNFDILRKLNILTCVYIV